jgi:hypothetical protein
VRALALLLLLGSPAWALNKQGARSDDDDGQVPIFNLSGYLFFGGFVFNPTYFARPDNTGRAALRFGLHLDLDLYKRYLSISYDENTFTDGSADSQGVWLPSEHDHVIGLNGNVPLPKNLTLTLAVHYELDAIGFHPNQQYRALHPDCRPGGTLSPPDCYDPNYSQSYVDLYARLTWTRGRFLLAAAIGGFAFNPTYAARPDNSGLALLRYVLHGEITLLPWLVYRLDFNFFTDIDEFPLQPTELDLTSEVAARWRDFEVRFIGEADLGLGKYPAMGPRPAPMPGTQQFYLAILLQWSFDGHKWITGK